LISDEVANTGPVADADISVKAAMLHLPDPRYSGQLQPERKTFIETGGDCSTAAISALNGWQVNRMWMSREGIFGSPQTCGIERRK
jgi:hypothetical protein